MEVQKIALFKAIALLNASGVKYALIDHNGVKHGELEIIENKQRKKTVTEYPFGSFSSHFLKYVSTIKPGESVVIPYGQFGVDEESRGRLRRAVAGWSSKHWGNGNHITHANGEGVQLLRL